MKHFLWVASALFVLAGCGETDTPKQASVSVAQASMPAVSEPSLGESGLGAKADNTVESAKEKAQKAVNAVKAQAKQTANIGQYSEGIHYEVLPQAVKTITPGKIEITEVFAYSCGHCFKFEPFIQPWKKALPDYIEVVQSPAIWRKVMEPHARILYTSKALGIFEQVHKRTFEVIHVEGKNLSNTKQIGALFAEFGIDEKKFLDTYNSFGVSSQVKQADARAKAMRVTGTPEIIVDGRFRVSSGLKGVRTQSDMLNIAQGLAQRIKQGEL